MKDLTNNKNSIASDLAELASLLESYNLIADGKSLYDASEKVRVSKDDKSWEYECTNLKFSMEGTIAGSIPKDIKLFEVIFNIGIKGIYYSKEIYSNPLTNLTFDLELEGYDENASLFYSSWHLDKHIRKEGDGESSYCHPEYHLTFGGNKMEERNLNYGDSLIIPSPRIFHPPMDAVLGIDFILQNYVPLENRKKVVEDPNYKSIVFNSQNRLWKPYYFSIASNWKLYSEVGFDMNFNKKMLVPVLI